MKIYDLAGVISDGSLQAEYILDRLVSFAGVVSQVDGIGSTDELDTVIYEYELFLAGKTTCTPEALSEMIDSAIDELNYLLDPFLIVEFSEFDGVCLLCREADDE